MINYNFLPGEYRVSIKSELTENNASVSHIQYSNDVYFTKDNDKDFVPIQWNGLESFTNFNADNVWTDGIDIYYTAWLRTDYYDSDYRFRKGYILDRTTSTWIAQTFYTDTSAFWEWHVPYGRTVWTPDNINIYFSDIDGNYIFNRENQSFLPMDWTSSGLPTRTYNEVIYADIDGADFWKNNNILYYGPLDKNDYITYKSTNFSSFTQHIFKNNNDSDFKPIGRSVWTDGINIYDSSAPADYSYSWQYKLNKQTNIWIPITWNGFNYISAEYLWTDGFNIYYSNNDLQYVLDTRTNTWMPKTWIGISNFSAKEIWKDGNNIYCCHDNQHYKFTRKSSIAGINIRSTKPINI